MKFWGKNDSTTEKTEPSIELTSHHFQKNITRIRELMSDTEDLIIKELIFNGQLCCLMYLETMVEEEQINEKIIGPILKEVTGSIEQIVSSIQLLKASVMFEVIDGLITGHCLILEGNKAVIYMAPVSKTEGRSIEEPVNEKTIKGSHEGFTESLQTNLYLIRKRMKNQLIKVKYFTIGSISNRRLALTYLDSLTNQNIIMEIEKRISSIKVDKLASSGAFQELIEDNTFSPFPQILLTERPDRVTSYLNEGKVIIVVDGDPRVLILPITFFAFYQSPDDYESRWMIASFFRLIRMMSFLIAISFPAIYIAIVSFHSEVLPLGILYSVKVGVQYVPFPPFLEAVVMQIILELLKEASIRLPSSVAQTIGIVGGLVIGTAVVQANIVSNTMIVVIGFTAIASFVVPIEEMGTSVRLLGFPMMVAAALFGFFGIVFTYMVIFIHLSKLETFGTPYFAPLSPLKLSELKDSVIRLPFWMFKNRPTDSKPKFVKQQWNSRVWKKNE
ncbi:spore germination protein [Peribacillus alkalitolerans]|uniref:spore germination protein n=1 Tax=Peribacillus alkalitolerans TaxID=1550385 RepID=UPI0013D47B63|nr:spore germination protein [Peribacillus alkalitolerans]